MAVMSNWLPLTVTDLITVLSWGKRFYGMKKDFDQKL